VHSRIPMRERKAPALLLRPYLLMLLLLLLV
jgi:hypothetical protein